MKNKKLVSALLGLGLLFTLPGCTDKDNKVDNHCGNINVIVKDVATNQTIKSVKVTLMASKSNSVTTDSYGRAAYNNIRIGSYQLLCEKEGYASIYYEAELDYETLETNVAVSNTTVTAYMFPSTGLIRGKVFESINSVRTKATKSYVLDVAFDNNFGGEFASSARVTVVNGEYTIVNAPIASSYYIIPQTYYETSYGYYANGITGGFDLSNLSYASDITYSRYNLY